MAKIRENFPHIPEKDWNEVMGIFKATEEYGACSVPLTREDLCVFLLVMEDAQNAANCGVYNKLTMQEIAKVWSKIHDIYMS